MSDPADTVAALTLHQPWASLMAVRNPATNVPYKRVETRSWAAPKALIGQRIVITAGLHKADPTEPAWQLAVEAPGSGRLAEAFRPLPLGAVVASGILDVCAPMFVPHARRIGETYPPAPPYWHVYADGAIGLVRTADQGVCEWGFDNELLVGDWTDRRYGWLIRDLASTAERCPACWGSGFMSPPVAVPGGPRVFRWRNCPRCSIDAPDGFVWVVGAGHCPPIPTKGRQRVWRWSRWKDEQRATTTTNIG